MELTLRVDLPCDVERAWAVLTDWERQADWMRDADRVTVVSPARQGIGVRLAVRTRLFGVPVFTEPMEVTGWHPPRELTIAHGGPVTGEGTWLLEPSDAGTLFTWTERIRLRVPLVGELAAWGYRPVMGMVMRRTLRGLRDAVATR